MTILKELTKEIIGHLRNVYRGIENLQNKFHKLLKSCYRDSLETKLMNLQYEIDLNITKKRRLENDLSSTAIEIDRLNYIRLVYFQVFDFDYIRIDSTTDEDIFKKFTDLLTNELKQPFGVDKCIKIYWAAT